jgi:hypothetical protein
VELNVESISCGLSLGDAGGKRRRHPEDCPSLSAGVRLRGGLKTEVADEAAAIPFVGFEHSADDVEIRSVAAGE